ncbi:hypothetical protein BKA70DRAFT_1307431 [Coprinopsis sp. MPI-PUGE-AT-0042]|nr:hypothetical protein BKA70DRAFT_1307431 [Coprinopsis sp. MPI-PUGE-AT-0042]
MSDIQDHPHQLAASLPTELLIPILRSALPLMMDKNGRQQFQQLCLVCSRWKNVCFSTPIFWSSLALKLSPNDTNSSIDLLRRWFSRAGEFIPLSLSFEDGSWLSDKSDDQVVLFIQTHQERWRYLFLGIHVPTFWKLLKDCPVDKWTNLCHFGMQDILIDKEVSENEDHPFPDHFPSVKELNLYAKVGNPSRLYPVAQGTVRRLTLNADGIGTTDYLSFLSKYNLLTHLDVHCVTDTTARPDGPGVALLKSLRHLSFTASSNVNNWKFIGRLRTPKLSELVLSFPDYASNNRKTNSPEIVRYPSKFDFLLSRQGVDSLPPSIRPLFESCNTGTLTKFSLRGTIPPMLFQSIVTLVPESIKTLDLEYWPYGVFGSSSVDYQSPTSSERRFFPYIESLRIAEFPSRSLPLFNSTMSSEGFVTFLSQRMEETVKHVKLRTLQMTRGENADKCIPDKVFEDLKKRGLEVVIRAQL